MRILHILASDIFTGAENVAADICMMFKDEHEMAYCSPDDGSVKRILEDRGVSFFPVRKMSMAEIKSKIKAFRPDIIHAHDVRATVLAKCTAGKIPVISHLHVRGDDMSVFSLKSLLYLIAAMRTKRVIVVSKSCLSDYYFGKLIRSKTVFLQNVIFLPRIEKLMYKDTKDYHFELVFLGRLCYQKDPQRIAKVASQVLKKCADISFGIIGEGELRHEMEAIFREEGVADRVFFTGRLDYPYKALKQAKCMLLCSRFEGTPIAALEAMALGVPIVSTPVDGMLDIIDNQRTGFLYSDDQALAEAVQKLLLDRHIHKEMSIAGINKFNDLNNVIDYKGRLGDIYLSAINL